MSIFLKVYCCRRRVKYLLSQPLHTPLPQCAYNPAGPARPAGAADPGLQVPASATVTATPPPPVGDCDSPDQSARETLSPDCLHRRVAAPGPEAGQPEPRLTGLPTAQPVDVLNPKC